MKARLEAVTVPAEGNPLGMEKRDLIIHRIYNQSVLSLFPERLVWRFSLHHHM